MSNEIEYFIYDLEKNMFLKTHKTYSDTIKEAMIFDYDEATSICINKNKDEIIYRMIPIDWIIA